MLPIISMNLAHRGVPPRVSGRSERLDSRDDLTAPTSSTCEAPPQSTGPMTIKLDVFNHVHPVAFLECLEGRLPTEMLSRWKGFRTMHDMDARVRMLEEFGDIQQILSLAQPTLDSVAGPNESPRLAEVANDGMAAFCLKHPDRFPSFVATLPMNNTDAAIKEMERAIGELGACGIQVHSNVDGHALDRADYFPIFERVAELGVPVWLHPARPISHPDYLAEKKSNYDIWWGLGWAYETSAAMARMVLSGMLDKLPSLNVICHHWGGYIPHAEGRFQHWEARPGQDGELHKNRLERPLVDYFKRFYADTAMFGAQAASQAGLDYFGPHRTLFATDCPYDQEGGRILIRDTIAVIEKLQCTTNDRTAIYRGTAHGLFGNKFR